MKGLECRSELVLRERGGPLSAQERMALEAHVAGCPACRLARSLGRDFDSEAALEPQDGALIQRLGLRARRWAQAETFGEVHLKPWYRRSLSMAAAAAFVVLFAAGASAALGMWIVRQAAPVTRYSIEPRSTGSVSNSRAGELPMTPERPDRASRALDEPPLSAAREKARARESAWDLKSGSAPRVEVEPETARSLFQKANEARRAGDPGRSILLYRKLQEQFPRAAEASLSQLRLGGLLLERNDPGTALAQYDRYLKFSPNGALTPEALYGRGRALAGLGRPADEQRTWTRLLSKFPASPYAAHAKRRLETLERP